MRSVSAIDRSGTLPTPVTAGASFIFRFFVREIHKRCFVRIAGHFIVLACAPFVSGSFRSRLTQFRGDLDTLLRPLRAALLFDRSLQF